MSSPEIENSQIAYARFAGFMYLFVDVAYAVALFITGRFQVPGNFAETAHRIMQSESLYRIGLSSNLLGSLCTIFIGIGLYGVLKPINENLALFGLLFRVVESAIFAVGTYVSFVALRLYGAAGHVNAFDANQLSALVNFLRSPSVAAATIFNIAAIFFSVGSALFFYLFLKTNYIPRILAFLGFFGSLLVPIVCFGSLIVPQAAGILQFGWGPIAVAEVLAGFYLLFKGINLQPRHSRDVLAMT